MPSVESELKLEVQNKRRTPYLFDMKTNFT